MRTYLIGGKKARREIELCLLKGWVCHIENLGFPLATWWDGESLDISCLPPSSPVPCPTTMVVAFGLFLQLIYSLSVGLRKERRAESLSAAIPSPSYISNGKGIHNKMLLLVYNSVIPFFSQGQKIWDANWICIIVFVSEGASLWNTQLWWELAGLGWELSCLSPTIHFIMVMCLHFTLLIIKNIKTRTGNALKSFQLTVQCVINSHQTRVNTKYFC